MKKLLLITCTVWMFSSCQNSPGEQPTLEGDLYYAAMNFGSFYGLPESVYQGYADLRDSVGLEALKKDQSQITRHMASLEKYGLVKSPYIYLKTDADSTFIIYMTPEDYQPITQFTYQDLIENQQKVRLQLITEPLEDNMLRCKKVISIEKMAGETFAKQRQFKIEDYR